MQPVYNKIGEGYNSTRKADPYIASRLYALLQPGVGGKYLDIGCGTGNYTCWFAEQGVDFTGVDPSEVMLEEARAKDQRARWLYGSAAAIPLPDEAMDGAIATLTIHHWTELEKGFCELFRVLKPGARVVIFSFTKEQETGYWLNHFFPEMMKRTFQKAITLETVQEAAVSAGFEMAGTEKYFVLPDLQDLFGYSGKHNPEIYFDPEMRRGISAFALLATEDEVATGLQQLRECIDKGEFDRIKKKYENDMGDYLFIVLRKS